MKTIKTLFSQKAMISILVILLLSAGYVVFSLSKSNKDFIDGEVITAEAMNENFNVLYNKVQSLKEN